MIHPTLGYQYTCGAKLEWAQSALAKLKPTYPNARIVYIEGTDFPYKVILYSSTLKSDVTGWRKRRPDIPKGFVIDLPVPQ